MRIVTKIPPVSSFLDFPACRPVFGAMVAVALSFCGQNAAFAGALEQAEAALRQGAPARAAQLLAAYKPVDADTKVRSLWAGAMAAMGQNNPQVAVELLTRLAVLLPNEPKIRMELGRALMLSGQGPKARAHLEAARAGALTAQDRQVTEAYLGQIAAAKQSETYLRFALIPDSNPGHRTAAAVVDVGGLAFVLNPDARAKSGTGLRLGFGHVFLPRFSDSLRGRFGLHFDGKLYQDSRITEATISAEAGLEKALANGAILGGGLTAQIRVLGGKRYSQGVGAYLTYAQQLGAKGYATARLEAVQQSYPGFAGASGLVTSLHLGYRYQAAPALAFNFGASFSRTQAQLASEAARTASLTLGVEKAFEGGLVLAGSVTKGRMRRDVGTALFPAARSDQTTRFQISAYHRDFQIGGFAPVVELTHERQHSNNPLNRFKSTRVSLGLTKRF